MEQLVKRAKTGEVEAFEELVRRFQSLAYGYAYSILGDFHLAEDAAQEAFLDTYQHLSDLREPSAFRSWLRNILYKHCDRLKRRKHLPMVALDEAADIATWHPGPDIILERKELQARVLSLVRDLPEEERAATVLFYMGGYSLVEVSEFLEVPISTIKNRMHSARNHLKEKMMDVLDESLNAFPLSERFTDVARQMRFVVDRIDPFARSLESLTARGLVRKTSELQRRVAKREARTSILAEAFAVMREASRRVLGQPHSHVQLIAGLILDSGWVAEIGAGEGKSIAVYPPAYMAVLEGKHTHLVTENVHVAKRDGASAAAVFEQLGVSVGVLDESKMGQDGNDRKEAYKCDITYGSYTEFGFNHLRSKTGDGEIPPDGCHPDFAIIDEVDRILIDEGRTPLIIAGSGLDSRTLVEGADQIARVLMREGADQDDGPFYELPRSNPWQVHLTAAGKKRIRKAEKEVSEDRVIQALRAHLLFQKDRDYVLGQGRVVILDSTTGRTTPARRFSDGLHQQLEMKEAVEVTRDPVPDVSIRIQEYFRLFDKLAGVTRTARHQVEEFRERYGMEVGVIPTRTPLIRVDHEDRVYPNQRSRDEAVVEAVLHYSKELERPVLVGVTCLEDIRRVSKMLAAHAIKHLVVDAEADPGDEGWIPTTAGRRKAVTIATEIAGRGVQFRLSKRAIQAGGLHVLGIGRHELRRIDDQLIAQAGRNGEPGSSHFLLNQDDELVRGAICELKKGDRQRLHKGEVVESRALSEAIATAQTMNEGKGFDIRQRLDDASR